MVYAGTSWEGPNWKASVAPRETILSRLKALPRAVLVAVAAVLVTLSLALAATAVQAHLRGPSCSSDAYRVQSWDGWPWASGEMSCSYGGWRHYSESDLYYWYRFWPDAWVDWTGATTTKRYLYLTTSGYYWEDYGCYYSYHWVDNHDSDETGCTWF